MLVTDYVCGMQVKAGKNKLTYLGVEYSFCSTQCRERFLANPGLYVGVPGQKAPKQEGKSIIKQRRMHLAEPLSTEQATVLSNALLEMMGVKSASARGDRLVIEYDLLEVTAEQIEQKLEEVGMRLGAGLSQHLRSAFVHYEEECELGSLEVRKSRSSHRHA